jgi:outer membrane receptor protein involved in Fe transport
MIRLFTLVLLTCMLVLPVFAQVIPVAPLKAGPGNFYGKIVEANTLLPLQGASVQLLRNKPDTLGKKKKDYIIATRVTGKKGEFNMEGLPSLGYFTLRVSFIGYKTYEAKVAFEGTALSSYGAVKDLGNIKLEEDPQELDNFTVNGSRPQLEMYLDKKVYNVEKNIAVSGGTAVDIFKYLPSVIVDMDGNVTMRNGSPLIYVDGMPGSLSPDQIPADQVATIELITNPSAKYDAGGGGAGILNIILKKNKKAGYNGNFRANIDSRGRPVMGADINLRQNKLNVFAAGQLFTRKNITEVSTTRTDFFKSNTINVTQENMPVAKGYFAFGRLGLDYFLDNRNTLTLSSNIVRGRFSVADLLDIHRDTVATTYIRSESAQRDIFADITYNNTGAGLAFKHNFEKTGHEWTADANYNRSTNTNQSEYATRFFNAAGEPKFTSAELATGGGSTISYTFQTDLAYPLSKSSRLESGARIAGREYTSWNDNFIKNPAGTFQLVDAIGVRFDFSDLVYAAYGTYTKQLKTYNFQAGLRVESSRYDGNLTSANKRFSNAFPVSLFPSFFLSKKLNSVQDLQLSYSRKINRPAFFQVLPFVDFSDSLNLTLGNPGLEPDFTQVAELNYSNQYLTGHSLITTLYVKYTNNLITRYQYKAPNTDPSKPDSVFYNSYGNARASYTAGLEITAKNRITSWWDINSNVNLFDVYLDARNLTMDGPDRLFSWFAKMSQQFKLPRHYTIQLSGDYQARTILPANSGRTAQGTGLGGGLFGSTAYIAQGYIEPYYGVDIAVKKDFLKNNAASLSLQFNDIFRTRDYMTHAQTGFFIQDNSRMRDPQVLRLNFSWRFGRMDAALFKRKNMKAEMENLQNMQQGQ